MMDNRLIDIKKLIAPVEGAAPIGEDLRNNATSSSIYYQIKDARMSARMKERKSLEGGDDTLRKDVQTEWQLVYQHALTILENVSKDLEITTWLIEALFRLHGFQGLTQGFELAAALIEAYWPDIFPIEDEDGLWTKVMVLAGLNGVDAEGALEIPLQSVAITDEKRAERYVLWQYKQSLDVAQLEVLEKKQKRYEQGIVPLEHIQKAAEQSGGDFYESLQHDVESARRAYQTLCQVIEKKSPALQLPSSTLFKLFDEIKELIGYLFQKKQFEFDSKDEGSDQGVGLDEKIAISTITRSQKTFSNRAEALEQLLSIAHYFRQSEPQSLLPYILERANRWGKLSPPELLREIIGDENARKTLFELTGINHSI